MLALDDSEQDARTPSRNFRVRQGDRRGIKALTCSSGAPTTACIYLNEGEDD
ncbi:hypothetical protein [Laspinema olomoucense]|uniref:hypothetical protein n=1 Tax=Laspinema olomoucense TaxID=3231600 RepID=UPI0021BA7ED0|nr:MULTISPECIES: hypothetical protein [unclassified Laspinema]MCT7972956.1 hypothetical protein [Laspinema sp. D3d]MCT7987073.1 hypothetical protein [Laspinema sp. D3a]